MNQLETLIENHQTIGRLAQERMEMSHLLASARTVSETDKQILEWLLAERALVVRLLQMHPEAKDDHDDFDFTYKRSFERVVSQYMSPWRKPILDLSKGR